VLAEAADQAQRHRKTLAAMSRLLKFVEEDISKFTDPALAKAVEVLQTSTKKRRSLGLLVSAPGSVLLK
jgi:hypothetical protein